MFRTAMAVMLAVAIVGVGVWLGALPAVAQQTPSATRSFDKTTVEPGGSVTVTITAGNYGGAGAVTEELPVGFSYVSSSLGSEQVTETGAQTVRFTLQGDTSFRYTVTASSVERTHTFSGTLRDSDRNDHNVGCPCVVTVQAAAQPPEDEPSATRSFDKTTVEPGGSVTVTITAGNYGGAGAVTEELPVGFSYVSSSLGSEQVTETGAQTVRFTLQGDTSFRYTVTASSVERTHTFSGTLRDSDRNDHNVGCPCVVTVQAAAQPPEDEPSATRSFDKTTVEPGGSVTVTITAGNYGGAGAVTEELPVGFSYVSSSLGSEQVTETGAQTVRFTLQGDTSFRYTVTASSVERTHTFSGTLRDSDRNDHNVGCPCVVTVQAAAQPPEDEPSATRSFDKTTVEPGGSVTVTITAGNYGGAGAVTEELPVGFSYVSSSLGSEQVTETGAQTVRFTLQGDTSFRYTVTASSVERTHTFSGTLRDSDRNDHNVGCPCVVTVQAAAQPPEDEPSATRSFDKTTVEPGGSVTVTITAGNYGGAGAVTEELPVGFSYVSSSLGSEQVTETGAQTVRFTLQGDTSFRYTVTASSVERTHTFSGTLRDSDRNDHNVGCPCVVTVQAAAQPPEDEPSATRSFDKTTVEPGGSVTVTITAGNYGGAGAVTEELPVGFSYVSSSLGSGQVTETGAQTVRFTLQGDTSFRYTVTASSVERTHTFSGTLRDSDRNDHNVGCPCSVTVRVSESENRPPAFTEGSSTTRTVAENTGAGTNVGGPVRAADRDGDTLTYSLTGIDAGSFAINSSGQIMVGTGTMLDFEDKDSYMVTVRATDPDNASDTISVTVTVGNVDEQGRVTLWAGTAVALTTPSVDQEIMAQVEDSDGNPGTTTFPIPMYTVITAGNVTGWQWARADAPSDGSAPAADATWTDISGAMNAAYTPAAADSDKFLKVTAMYTTVKAPARLRWG